MNALAEQRLSGKIACPECGHYTCQVFPDGGRHCFHPKCSYHASAETRSGEPPIPLRKKPKRSKKALQKFDDLPQADPRHPYFKSHRHRGDYALQIDGIDIRQDGDWLAIGMYDASGKLKNIQFIGPNGQKRFLKGCSTRGLFYRLGSAGTVKVALAEGVATAISFWQATGLDTYVTFGCDNLAHVAHHLHSIGKQVAICGDTGDGARIAEEVAAAVGGELFVPEFPEGVSGTDANDFAQHLGVEKLRRAIEQDTAPIPPPPDLIRVCADMPPSEFRKQSETLAAYIGMSVADLEKEVKKARQEVVFEETVNRRGILTLFGG